MKNEQRLADFRAIVNEDLTYFAEIEEHEFFIKCTDSKLPSMYSHNCIMLKETLNGPELHAQIEKLLAEARQNEAKHLNIVLHPNQEFAITAWEADAFEHSALLYMAVPFDDYQGVKAHAECTVYEVTSPSHHRDSILLDVACGITEEEEHSNYRFAYKRAHRKQPEFERHAPAISQYIAYLNDVPVGKCEVFHHQEGIHVEDFSVIAECQRKGIGTAILNTIAENGKALGAKELFLTTDAADTAKEMYKKLGFQTIGVEHHLLWVKNS
jgi:spore maturation protein CgeE